MKSRIRQFLSDRKADWKEFWNNEYGAPLHGDLEMQKHFIDLVKLGITSIVETGTFRGDSTRYFAAIYRGPIFTCEINRAYFRTAKRRLPKGWQCAQYDNVTLERMDSVEFLLKHKHEFGESPLFFLDAHWRRDFPLKDELAFIRLYFKRAIIVIDDFKIPGRDSAYDSYDGVDIDEKMVREIFPNAEIQYPASGKVGYATIFLA